MGTMNLLQSKWDGKVGQLVGAKWKNKATVHALTKPKDAQTESQLKQRAWFKPMQKQCFLYAQYIKGLTNISYKNMGLGNALIKFNKGLDIGANNDQLQNIQLAKTENEEVYGYGINYGNERIILNIEWFDRTKPVLDAENILLIYNGRTGNVQLFQNFTIPWQIRIPRVAPYDKPGYFYLWGRRKVNGKYVYLKQIGDYLPL